MKFEGTDNPIYNLFFSKSQLNVVTEKSEWRGKPSKNSFCFVNPKVKYKKRNEIVRDKLRNVFGIKNDVFNDKFNMAIAGDGQEVKRIAVLHSSSLAALLMFYSISMDKQLHCTLDCEDYSFYNSFFEVKTQVKGTHFSNMDVVLVGKNSNNKDVIFFVECKFSEYLNTGMCNDISIDAYKDKYNDLGLLNKDSGIDGLHFIEGKGKENVDCLQIKSDTPQYCHGIKQMISHFIGVNNFVEKKEESLDKKQADAPFYKELPKLISNDVVILLGEVVFDFGKYVDKKDDNNQNKLSSYGSIYSDLAKILDKHTSQIKVLPEILTYQELMRNFELDPKVKLFYQL